MRQRRFDPFITALSVLVIAAAAFPAAAAGAGSGGVSAAQRATLLEYARDTWASFVAMTDAATGLPADSLAADGTPSIQTSTTNIGAYMWSTVVAERLGIIGHTNAVARLDRTLRSLETMERHQPSGQYFNWYDHTNGEVLTVWPPTGATVTPILSSVDNGWLAAAMQVVDSSVPELSKRAGDLFDSMHFGFYYRPAVNRIAFHYTPSTGDSPCCYDTIVSESRIASYIGIATGELPPKEYFGAWRTFPDTCDWNWHETKPVGFRRTYLGVDVFEGAYPYEDYRVVPGWGGSMFEALMPALFVPEERWGPRSWAINHPLTVAAQIHHGLVEAEYGYWGFSPSNVPEGGYSVYGVDALGMNPEGYPSNEGNTFVDRGFEGCDRDPKPDPPPSAYTNGVVTPHAAFLALRWAPDMVLENLASLKADFEIYDQWGFRDSVNVQTGTVSDAYLSLDQGIIMAAIGNALAGDVLRDAFATNEFRKVLRPVIGMESFNAGPRGAAQGLH
ncbi:MAG TPA: glucoamylase family protein [Candidatus Limnocylindrales bacterium]|nr:glucoamylase family protein [Candidatus Limnocylindrales bacterium]